MGRPCAPLLGRWLSVNYLNTFKMSSFEFSPLEREHSQFYHSLNISNNEYLYFAVLGWFEEGKSPEYVAHLLCELTPPADLQRFGGWYFPHVVSAVRELAGDLAEL